jgi:hypothetical protein
MPATAATATGETGPCCGLDSEQSMAPIWPLNCTPQAIGSRPLALNNLHHCPTGWCLAPIAKNTREQTRSGVPCGQRTPTLSPDGSQCQQPGGPSQEAGLHRRRRGGRLACGGAGEPRAAAGRPASTGLGRPLMPPEGASRRASLFTSATFHPHKLPWAPAGMACAWSLSRFPERFEVEVWESLAQTGGVASTCAIEEGARQGAASSISPAGI